MFNRQHHEDPMLAPIRAEIASLDARLAADVSGLDDGGDPFCKQALLDAGERLQVAGGMKASATTAGELRLVRRTLIEGLASTRQVRERRGLPLGPDLPSLDEPVAPAPVAMTPGAYGPPVAGGVPMPFWKKALAIGGAVAGGEMLGDMLSGGMGGGMGRDYDGDYDGGDFDGGGFDGGGFDI